MFAVAYGVISPAMSPLSTASSSRASCIEYTLMLG